MRLEPDNHAWIFVSHASADLLQVRKVRNYLEEKGASPLLFHLRSLKDPDEFWPLIEREIEERSFFLYCDSPAAATSPWVRRERAKVAEVARVKQKVVCVGEVRVDTDVIDTGVLDEFLAKTRVFPSYSHADLARVTPFLDALREAGFQVYRESQRPLTAADWKQGLDLQMLDLEATLRHGWVIPFLTRTSVRSPWVEASLRRTQDLGGRFMPVLLEPVEWLPREVAMIQYFDATREPEVAAARLTRELLRRAG